MSKKKDPKYDTELEKNVFSWGIISTDVTIANGMKKKARGGYDQRYVVLSRNYIMYYKPATKEGTPQKYDLPRGVINLRRVLYDEVKIDADNSSFLVPTAKRIFEFKSSEDKVLMKWVRVVKERAEVISKVQVEELVNFNKDIMTIQTLFPKNFCVTPKLAIECLDKIIEDRTKSGENLKKWDPFVRKAALFLECYFGQNRNYVDWFVGSDGPSRIVQSTEEEMLSQWKGNVEKALKGAPEAATIRFFQEDLEPAAQLCDQAVLCIDGINRYSRLFINTVNYVDQYAKEKEVLTRFATSFRAFPSERTVDYRTHRGGTVRGANGDEFVFAISGGVVSFKGKRGTTQLNFFAQGPEISSHNAQHGTIVWNTRTWVWYHPTYPHTIRFDLDKSGNFVFRASPSANSNTNTRTTVSGRSASNAAALAPAPTPAPAYANWVWQGGVLRSAGGAAGAGDKRVPEVGEWRVDGDVPVAAVMLAAMSEFIIQNSM